jgi:hypothetical protein
MYYLLNSVFNSLMLRENILGRYCANLLALKPFPLCAVDVLVVEAYLREEP